MCFPTMLNIHHKMASIKVKNTVDLFLSDCTDSAVNLSQTTQTTESDCESNMAKS